jgi:asparagine synthase (glutamine-hydrolysing)
MSAIAGIWNEDGRPDVAERCRRMLAAQSVYGADERQWAEGPVALGRRLFATLPEDRFDRQPLASADGRLVLVADLRIDNRDELAVDLALGGAAARLSDAGLLLAAFVRWGEGALDRIAGDFAFALWDARRRRMLLGRDPVGQRPLHYHRAKGFVAFASMPKGLHALPEIPYRVDGQAIAEFLAVVPSEESRSFFESVRQVPAGSMVEIAAGGVALHRYWNPKPPGSGTGRDHAEGLRHHLDEAVRSRLRGAGEQVGSHLSGGYDSAAVTATAARLTAGEARRVVAFTAVPREGYGNAPGRRIADEGPLAAETARLYPNVDHVRVRAPRSSPLEGLDRDLFLFGRPVLNLCNRGWYHAINDSARDRQIRVMLTGQMGNASLSYHGLEFLAEMLAGGRWVGLAREAALLVARGGAGWKSVAAHALGPFMPGWAWRAADRLSGRDPVDRAKRARMGAFETRLWMLKRADLGTMNKGMLAGWGLDQRDPTTDRRLLEFCLAAPREAFVSGGETRRLARRALADRLPAGVLGERRKGYQDADWHERLDASRDEIEAEVARLRSSALAAELLDLPRLEALVAEWPRSDWHSPKATAAYRYTLLRALSAGSFIRTVGGDNR